MNDADAAHSVPARPRISTASLAAATAFVLHLIGNPHYGFFRDELYFIMCGRHPAWGYVDQPPLTPLLAAATQALGPSLVLLRAMAALFAGASIYVTCLLAKELGGGRFAQLLAALVAFFCPVLMNFGMKVSTDMVGLVGWPCAALFALRALTSANTPDAPPSRPTRAARAPRATRDWALAGVAIGVSFEGKYSVVYFAAALVVGLLATSSRRALASRGFAIAIALATAIALPNVIWQAAHGFPMLELLQNGQRGKNVILSPLQFVLAEVLITNPILALVWIAGVAWLFTQPRARFLGVAFVALIAMMIASHAKHYYPANAYPIAIAAGGVAIESLTARAHHAPVARAAVATLATAAGLMLVPYVMPVLPVPRFLAYDRALAPVLHTDATKTEHHKDGPLPQDWADMHGWPELARTVATVADTLTPEERARALVVAGNYGEAAAIEFFGEALGVPPVASGHNQYFLWGMRGRDGDVIIDVDGDCGKDAGLYRSATLGATFTHPLVMPYETDLPIMICRGMQKPLAEVWPSLKTYR